jgi:hypothetical protein
LPEAPVLLENWFRTTKEDEQLIEADFKHIAEREGTKIYHKHE